MILKNIKVRAQFTKDSQSFWFIIELERDGGGVQRRIAEFKKGTKAEDVAKKLEDLAQQIKDI